MKAVWYWRGGWQLGDWKPADPAVPAELGGAEGNVGGLLGELARMGYPAVAREPDEGPPLELRPLGQTFDVEVARARARVALGDLGHQVEETAGAWTCRGCAGTARLDRFQGTRTGLDLLGPLVAARCSAG